MSTQFDAREAAHAASQDADNKGSCGVLPCAYRGLYRSKCGIYCDEQTAALQAAYLRGRADERAAAKPVEAARCNHVYGGKWNGLRWEWPPANCQLPKGHDVHGPAAAPPVQEVPRGPFPPREGDVWLEVESPRQEEWKFTGKRAWREGPWKCWTLDGKWDGNFRDGAFTDGTLVFVRSRDTGTGSEKP